MIDLATQQKIKDTADIVDVVGDYVHLVRSGGGYKGLCPFHNERTPSFSVNRARNFCYCFSCKKGGSPVNFLMQKEGLSYYEALRQLAKRYGIKIEEKELTDQERDAMEHREALYLANEWAMEYFEHNLREEPDGRDIGLQYFYSRGVTDEAIRKFHLGYALDKGKVFTEAALRRGFKLNILKELGLTGTSQQGQDYDRFRGRVIFPIMSSSNKVVGFGGRTLKASLAKYVNSPESDIYKKSFELYGMSQARQDIVKEDHCYLVEGYLDVIGMWQAGLRNVVASSGTALTNEQIALIHRFTQNVTLVYDGDSAGIKAALRGMDMLLDHNMNVSLLLLPDGDDPDSFSRKHTSEEVKDYFTNNSTDVIRFKARILMEEAEHNPQKRVEAIRSIVGTLAHITDKVKRDIYIQECSKIMNVSEEAISSATADAQSELKEKKKRERAFRKLNDDIATGRISPQPKTDSPLPSSEDSDQPHQAKPSQSSEKRLSAGGQGIEALRPMEWKVLQFCLRYGFLDFCESFNEMEGEEKQCERNMLTVVEYVQEEMRNDDFEFSNPHFRKVFDLIIALLPRFRSDLGNFNQKLAADCESRRKEGVREIAEKGLSLAEIQREEQILEEKLTKWFNDEKARFARDYVAKEFASHEDDMVRKLTNEAILEPHSLSQIYSREQPVQTEEEKLFTLLPMAITVWKNGILDRQFKLLLSQFHGIVGKGNLDEERRLQAKIQELMKLRSEFARNIGDRIICPDRLQMH